MHAVFLEVDTNGADMDAARANLEQNVVPRLRERGAVAAYWLGEVSKGRRVAFMIFEDEAAAKQQASEVTVGETPVGAPPGIKIRTVQVTEVVANL